MGPVFHSLRIHIAHISGVFCCATTIPWAPGNKKCDVRTQVGVLENVMGFKKVATKVANFINKNLPGSLGVSLVGVSVVR